MTMTAPGLQRLQVQLSKQLEAVFGQVGTRMLNSIYDNVSWVELQAGEVLMQQGDPGDAAYLSLSGRLRVYVRDGQGDRMIRELGRGEIIGEMSLFTGEPRSATVVAVRKTILARIDKSRFDGLMARHPQASMALTREIIHRLQTQQQVKTLPAPVMVNLMPVTDGQGLERFAERLKAALEKLGQRVFIADVNDITSRTQSTYDQSTAADLTAMLDTVETDHDCVLMLSDPSHLAWSQLCAQHADEVLLIADADAKAAIHPLEQACLMELPQRSVASETLVLMHPADRRSPMGMRRWLERRPVTAHINLRPDRDADMDRLARILSRQAVGLVLAGGGARGFAHLGIWKALREQGIDVDVVGGTSMGAVMAAVIACDVDVEESIAIARDGFKNNPTSDYNWLPMISLIKGHRARRAVLQSLQRLTGGTPDIVDLWKGYFCIASNYSRGQEMRLTAGDLGQSMMASFAIPGALPPVIMKGDLLCDGGTFNNFPTDVMRQMRGVGRVIGVDLSARNPRSLEFDDVPDSWTLLWDRWKGRRRRKYWLPSLTSYLLNVSILYSVSRLETSRQACDLFFSPPLSGVGLLQWHRFDQIVAQGYEHAAEVLAKNQSS